MDIFTPPQPDPVLETLIDIAETNKEATDFYIAKFIYNWDLVWYNQRATPQQIFTGMGGKAFQLFQAAAITQQYLSQIRPDFVPLQPPQSFVINADGTVISPMPQIIDLAISNINNQAVLTWSYTPSAISYNITRNDGIITNILGNLNSFTDTTVVAGSTYSYTVTQAYTPGSFGGNAESSNQVSITF